jgi:PAS domain S-box-containing protein
MTRAAATPPSRGSKADLPDTLRAVIESTPALVYVVDAAHRFVLINRKFGELFGLDVNTVAGRRLSEVFPREVADTFAANNQRVLQERRSIEFEEVAPHPDGPHIYVTAKSPLFDADGEPWAVCGVSTDITERKRLTAALQAAQRHKETAVATLGHELRQPLAAIQGALALMRARPDREKGQRARAVVERQVLQLSRLVDDLLDASRITRGNLELRPARIRLNEVLDSVVTTVQPLVKERRQEMRTHISPEAIWLDADALRLQQVFSNLLTNASKFTPAGGRITLEIECDAQAAVIRVRDTGRGIAADALPHIFELFAQASPDERGLGIGLAIVRTLVERHGGTVQARSAGAGLGSEFIVRLPVAAAPA